MNIKLVTGNTLETSVEASDDRALYAGIVGTGDYVFGVGQRFAHQIIGYGTVRIFDGEGIMQGAHFIIPNGKYDDIEIDACVEGFKRIDLICARYRKIQNMETVELVVVKGVETVGTPQAPEVTVGSILEDTSEHNMPLKKVTVQGSAIIGIENVFEVVSTIFETSTEAKAAYDKAKQALGEDEDTAWKKLPLASGVGAGSFGRTTPVYRKIGKQVFIEGMISLNFTSNLNNNGQQVATIPEGFRPKYIQYYFKSCTNMRIVRVNAKPDGSLIVEYIFDLREGKEYTGNVSWIDIGCSFFVD